MAGFFENSYERLTEAQAEAYLARIGLSGGAAPNRGGLDTLIYRHQRSVPFETLSPHDLREAVLLDVDSLFDKIVLRRRGGYCFENNAAFLGLLRALGFDAFPCGCRVTRGLDYPRQIRHRGTLVRLEEELYFCDVGFGGAMCPRAVPVREGEVLTCGEESFFFRRLNDWWWDLVVTSPYREAAEAPGEPRVELTVGVFNSAPADFELANAFCSTHPDSPFVRSRYVHMRTENGYLSLKDRTLTVMSGGGMRSRELSGPEEVYRTLTDRFGLLVPREEWLEKAAGSGSERPPA